MSSYTFHTDDGRPHLLVVGAGVGGLSVAMRCARYFRVTIAESSDRVGGLVRTVVGSEGKPLELGPSHHLEDHVNFRTLVKYGVPGESEVTFGSGEEIIVCDETSESMKVSDVAKREKSSLARGDRPDRTCVPWADETAAFDIGDAASGALATSGKKRLTARLGYQRTLESVKRRLQTEEGVSFHFLTEVVRISRLDGEFVVETRGPQRSLSSRYSAVVMAAPPSQARLMRLPPDVRVPSDEQTKPIASSRTVLSFTTVPREIEPAMIPGRHYVSDADGTKGFRWAVVLSKTDLLLSYVDGGRAEKQLNGQTSTHDLAESFLKFLSRKKLVRGCFTAEQLILSAEVHIGGSTHAFHAPGTRRNAEIERSSDFKFVGEAYGPPYLRAWMESASYSALEAAKELFLNFYPTYEMQI
jgi:glycine/D-amino acid oxidase-like deaminating enzyme